MIKGKGFTLKHRSELSPKRNAELDAKHAALMAKPRKPTVRWLVWGRPVGSRTWSLASRNEAAIKGMEPGPAIFCTRRRARLHAAWMRKHQRCYWGGVPNSRACQACVVKVILPK